ncbi:MAG: hypothetical protein Q7J16_08380 [Candidatus Cloacimonadales bacterium]|nr:hypothetical protein [Candidatus Cloacimonadales bacterium]
MVNRNILHFAESRFSTHEDSNFEDDVKFSMPDYFTFGLVWKRNLNLYLDNELIMGHYGGKSLKYMKLWFLRAGVEKYLKNNLALRFGLTYPVIAETSTLGDIRSNLPNPKFTLSAGCGYKFKKFGVDVAFFFNPGQSYVQRKPVPAVYLSGTVRY